MLFFSIKKRLSTFHTSRYIKFVYQETQVICKLVVINWNFPRTNGIKLRGLLNKTTHTHTYRYIYINIFSIIVKSIESNK